MTAPKRCVRCGDTKPATEFQHRKGTLDGRCPHCRECENTYRRAKYSVDRHVTMPSLQNPLRCPECLGQIYDHTDGNGMALVTCLCGTQIVRRRKATKRDAPIEERDVNTYRRLGQTPLTYDERGRLRRRKSA